MRWLQFILSHSIFIAFCALALCWQTSILLQLSLSGWLYCFVFFSTMCSYNFYWLISKYSFASHSNLRVFFTKNKSYLLLFFMALIGMMISFFFIITLTWWILLAILLTALYSLPLWPYTATKKLRRLGFAKTILLAFTWAYVTAILPAASNKFEFDKTTLLLLAARFFFMLMLCAIFDRRDAELDKMKGLHSLATDTSNNILQAIMIVSFIGYITAGILVRESLGNNWHLVSFIITACVVWIVYRLSLKKQGYNFYYFIVDGLMLLSALFTWLATQAASI